MSNKGVVIAGTAAVLVAAVAAGLYVYNPCLFGQGCPLSIPQDGIQIGQGNVEQSHFDNRGWSSLEQNHIWSTSETATLPINCAGASAVSVTFAPYSVVPVDVSVSINNGPAVARNYPKGSPRTTETIPTNGASTCVISFNASPLSSPSEHGSADKRRLGVSLSRIDLVR